VSAGAGEIVEGRPGTEYPTLTARVSSWRPWRVLVGVIVCEWVLVLGLAVTVRHNGWVYYQGGDQLWYYTLGRQLVHGQLWQTSVGYLWSFVLAPIAGIAGPDLVSALPAVVLLDVLVLLPIAILALYGIGARLGGRLFGYWALFVWLVLPFVGIKFTNSGYHQRYTELLLPQGFGLTAMADFPTMVAVLVSIYFATKALTDRTSTLSDGAAVGTAAGIAIAIKPSAALFILGPLLAFVLARQSRMLVAAALAMALPIVTLAVWKARGLGQLPLLSAHGGRPPAGLAAIGPVAGLNLRPYFGDLSLHQLALNIDLLREHFWSGHVAVWLLLAGLVAIARRSPLVGALVGGAALPFAIIKGSYPQANFEDGSLFRILMPIYPFFALGIAALPFLIPGFTRRLRDFEPVWSGPSARTRAALVGVSLVLTALIPLAVTATASTSGGSARAATAVATEMPIPVDVDIGLRARVVDGQVLLQWRRQHPIGGAVFYHVWRSTETSARGLECSKTTGAESCVLDYGTEVGLTRDPARYDKPTPGTWVYRVGVAANWLNDPAFGDVYFTSPPVVVAVP
jgi:hypothetical protein